MKSHGVGADCPDLVDTLTKGRVFEIRNRRLLSAWQVSEAQGSGACQAIVFRPHVSGGLSTTFSKLHAFLRGQRLPQRCSKAMNAFPSFRCSQALSAQKSLQFLPHGQEFAFYVARGEAFQVLQGLIYCLSIRCLHSADALIASDASLTPP
jgi:hypothetical protein